MKIRNKINISFILVFVISLVLIVFSVFYFSNRFITELTFQGLESNVNSKKDHLNTYFSQNIERLRLITSRTKLRELLNEYNNTGKVDLLADIKNILNDAKEPMSDFKRICIIGIDGNVLVSTDSDYIGIDCNKDDFFVSGKERDSIFFKENGTITEMIASGPIYFNGTLLGVGVVIVDINVLKKITLTTTNDFKTAEYLLAIGGDGDVPNFLTQRKFPDRDVVGGVDQSNLYEPMNNALKGIEKRFLGAIDYRGVEVVAVSAYLSDYDVGLVGKIDRKELFAGFYNGVFWVSIILLLVLFIFLIVSYFISKKITDSIYKLISNVDVIEFGDFDYDVIVNSSDEIEDLSKSFSRLIKKIKKDRLNIEKRVKQRTEQLEKINKAMVGRELEMIKMKKLIEEQKQKK